MGEEFSALSESRSSDVSDFGGCLRRHAITRPNEISLRHLPGGAGETTLTYSQLDEKARTIAARLQALFGLRTKGARALLLYEGDLEFAAAFLGCLYAGVIAVPAYPPHPKRLRRELPRLNAILRDCGPSVVLTTSRWKWKLRWLLTRHPRTWTTSWIATDRLAEGADRWLDPGLGPADVAFLQYTSGSTGAPKGVRVTHGNLLHQTALITRAAGLVPGDHCVTWLPLFHDMGLIGTILTPIAFGIPSTFFSPLRFLKDPVEWLRVLSRYRGTHSGGPNFAYELVAARANDDESLDLSSWRVAFCGAEPVRENALAGFAERFSACGFRRESLYPTYGLAEATLMVTGRHGVDTTASVVSCGSSILPDTEVRIVDPVSLDEVADGVTGEIWVSGPSVAEGYWGRDSGETFRARTAKGAGPFLRTGDLGFKKANELHVSGRLKDLVIVNGRNLYPADLEVTATAAHPSLRPGGLAAFSIQTGEGERLVFAAETRGENPDEDSIRRAIQRAILHAHEVPVHDVQFLKKGELPKTTSGKVQRTEAKARYQKVAAAFRPLPEAGTETRDWLVLKVSGLLGKSVPEEVSLAEVGLDSAHALTLASEISRRIGADFSPTLFWRYPTVRLLADYLDGHEKSPARAPTRLPARQEAIAVVGMAARFPGAPDIASFWSLVREGRSAVADLPAGRWRWDDYPDDVRKLLEGSGFLRGGYVDHLDRFDAAFFGISPREAALMDPQQRVLLHTAWDAFADAGVSPRALSGTRAGAFVGASSSDYAQRLSQLEHTDVYLATGNAHSILSNRLSFLFDWRGPSQTIDTACSSSLVAVVEAARSLQRGECDVALAAGVNAILSPWLTYLFAKAGMLSPDGRCASFGHDANGYVRGEGCGAVVLKRLDRALADKDAIYGVIRGAAINHGGRTASLTAPSAVAQAELIREAAREARVSSKELGYLEAHGTGTRLGDPIEAEGWKLAGVRSAVGTVKTQIGHLEAAAGIAGFIKSMLVVAHGEIPPLAGFVAENPLLKLDGTGLRVPTACQRWEGRRLAGVSSFGFGGTNAHVVLEAWPGAAARRRSEEKGPERGERHWVPEAPRARGLHPLVDENVSDWEGLCFEKRFCPDAFYLRDHVIRGRRLLPGVVYLEIARAVSALAHRELKGVRDLVWAKPLYVDEVGTRARYRVDRDARRLRILDDSGGHLASAHLEFLAPAQRSIDLVALRTSLRPGELPYDRFLAMGFEYGPAFRAMTALYTGETESLAEIALPPAVERGNWGLPPSMLDAALGACIGVSDGTESGTYVPSALDAFWICGPCPNRVFAHARLRESSETHKKYDVTVVDPDGDPVCVFEGALLRRLAERAPSALGVYEAQWEDLATSVQPAPRFVEAPDSLELLLETGKAMARESVWWHARPGDGARIAALGRSLGADWGIVESAVVPDQFPRTRGYWRYVDGQFQRRRFEKRTTAGKSALVPGGRYVITGATGGLGRLLTRYLVDFWNAEVVPWGRGGAVLDKPIDGIFHLAGAAPSQSLAQSGAEEWRRVLDAKLGVARAVDAAAAAYAPFFVAFSSVSSVIGDFGAGSYAVANAALDAWIEERAKSLPSFSLQWPYWKDGGMRLPAALEKNYEDATGFARLPTDIGFESLESLLSGPRGVRLVAYGDLARVEKLWRPFVVEIENELPTLAFLRRTAASLLGMREDAIDPARELTEYGADSVNMMEFLQALQARFGGSVTASTIFENPTLLSLERALRTEDVATPAPPVEESHFPLSAQQSAAVFLHRLAPESPAYHIPMRLSLDLRLETDRRRARAAVEALVGRHDILGKALALDPPRHEAAPAFEWTEHETLDFRIAAKRPFDLEKGPLLRVDTTPDAILFTVHHAIFDGYSCRIFLEDFLSLYEGKSPPPPARPYRDYVRWQQAFLESPEAARQEGYWLSRFATPPPPCDFPSDFSRPARSRFRGDTVRFDVPTEGLKELARAEKTTPFSVLLCAFFTLQHRYTGESDLVVGTPLYGRTQPGFERTLGYFVNMAALRESALPDDTFRALVRRTSHRVREALAHGDYPFSKLVEKLALPRDPARSPLFQTCFVYQTGLGGTEHVDQQEGQFDLELEIFDSVGYLKYDSDLFRRETAMTIADSFRALVAAALRHPDTKLGDLELPSITHDTAVEISREPIRLSGRPSAVAVRYEGESLTYEEFEARVDGLAAALDVRGRIVAVRMERGIPYLVRLHAIWRAGGAYCPVDPSWPEARAQFVFQEITKAFETDSLAYVLYTSGSTGEPKGVLTEHAAIANRIRWMQAAFPLLESDVVLHKTPYTFDVSVWELFWPLSVGARLVIARPRGHLDVSYLQETIREEGVTTVHFVPSMLAAFLSGPPRALPSLRRVFCSGEALTTDLVDKFLDRYPGVKLYNLYGPTEAAVDVSWWECRRGESPVPLGVPVANTTLPILDARGQRVPVGVPGELHIGGRQLARGYLNREVLTREKFYEHPSLGRLYRTGDLARYRADGVVEFLGRRDTQVKLRGLRIELGEIEINLARHPGVRAAAVAVHGETSETQRLVAYIVGTASESELLRHLAVVLPTYMIPAAWVFVDALPLTESGKLDRKQLAPPVDTPARSARSVPGVVRRVFERFVGEIDEDRDFFRAGGTSLQAIVLVEALRRECGLDLALADFYAAPTPRAVASPRPRRVLDLEAEAKAVFLPERFAPADAGALKSVLFTGGTGFFGGHLVRELVRQTDATIFCLVRGNTGNLPKHARVIPVKGALDSIPELDVDCVVHNAARVHFLEPYEKQRASNVEGTASILRYCATGKPKRLHYISTISVFHAAQGWVTEDSRPPAHGLTMGYAASKWVAEALVERARDRGLDAVVYRPGTLSGDGRTGASNADDFFSRFLQGTRALRVLPDLPRWVEFLPVDWAAKALVALLVAPAHANYHLVHPEPISMNELARRLGLPLVPYEDFRRRLGEAEGNRLQPLLPLFDDELHRENPRFCTVNAIADLSTRLASPWAPAMDRPLLDRYHRWLEEKTEC